MPEETQTPHHDKELARKEREEARSRDEASRKRKQQIKKSMTWGIAIIVIGLLGYLLWQTSNVPPPFTATPVHWHAAVNVYICGTHKDLPHVAPGQSHLGNGLLHIHDDNVNQAHIEGQIKKKEDVTISEFFEETGVEFTDDGIMGYKNGDLCGQKPGQLAITVNGRPTNYSYSMRDSDKIEIRFE